METRPSSWSTIDTVDSNIIRAGLMRSGSSLNVAWSKGNVGTAGIYQAAISPTGSTGPITQVAGGWSAQAADPVLTPIGVASSGLRGTPADADYWAGNGFLMDAAGGIVGTLSASQSAYAGDQDAIVLGGAPVFVFTQGGEVRLHTGTAEGTDTVVYSGGCCTYHPSLRQDASGVVWVAWYANSDSGTEDGWMVRQVLGLPGAPSLGPVLQAPGAKTGGDSVSSNQRAALAVRPGGEVWFAYPIGYPSPRKIRTWKLGTSVFRDLTASRPLDNVALSSDGSGRLWLAWSGADGNVRVVRSNTANAQWGRASSARAPQSVAYSVALDASLGTRADVVINSGSTIDHRQFLPGLSGAGGVKIKKNGTLKLKIKVTDAGAAVSGAAVTVKGLGTETTNSNGKAKFIVAKKHKRKAKVTVSKAGYASASFKVKLKP